MAKKYAKRFVYGALSLAVLSVLAQQAQADDDTPSTEFADLVITTTHTKPTQSMGETKLNRRELNEQQVQNSHDLVRYNTEVDVAEAGRYGNKGFAIRGVDGNRVAMNVDGVALPEVESNEIFSPYGYMYEGRFNPDVEMMRQIRIQAGADSLTTGSGAVGGSVSYSTKEPKDLVKGDNSLGGYVKAGYYTKNTEQTYAVGLAGVSDQLEFLVNYAYRDGHETKNHANRKADNARLDPYYLMTEEEMPVAAVAQSAIYPDPTHFNQDSYLAKLYYKPTNNHRFGLHGLYQYRISNINTQSKKSTGGRGGMARRAWDEEEMTLLGGSYRYTPQDGWLDYVDLTFNDSTIIGVADTWDYYEIGKPWSSISREYRPITTKSKQYRLEIATNALDFGKLGHHTFGLKAGFNKINYVAEAITLSHDAATGRLRSTGRPPFAMVDANKRNWYALLTDKIELGDNLVANLGLRYDNHYAKPYFDDTQFPEIKETKTGYLDSICTRNPNMPVCKVQQVKEGTHTKQLTWASGLDYRFNDKVAVRYKIGTGFLTPTISQAYMSFMGFGAKQLPNVDLKPETSLNQELELALDLANVSLTTSGYITKYKNFIQTKYWQGSTSHNALTGCEFGLTCMTSQNLDTAKAEGFKLGVRANFSKWFGIAGDLQASVDYHFMQDSAKVDTDYDGVLEVNTLASAPTTAIIGLDYRSPKRDWDIHFKARHISAKRADQTKGITIQESTNGNPYKEVVQTYRHIDRSREVTIFDVYGAKRFGKNQQFILNAGVYNLTNVEYIPWETLRMFNNVGVNASIDKEGYGFNRYTAAGRNYAVSLTYEF
ncbi:MAG: TonB-dependent hemoglobin/transferrin/lactoferrin family receptor [Moraxella sp.]|nr:TonB-dependent hemoglobin/transferrin/lactoferrin family receptor [Moraxella sp.]